MNVQHVLVGLLIVYVAYGFLLYLMQGSMIYYPDKTPFEECPLPEEQKQTHGKARFYLTGNLDSDKQIIIYHGNAGRACDRVPLASIINNDYAYIIVEYPGYGERGNPSKQKILEIVKDVKEYAEQQEKETYLLGISLGSSVAAYHASISNPEGLIMIAPFYSVASMARRTFFMYPIKLMLRENYESNKYLEGYSGRILILHGENDHTIPSSESEKLQEKIERADRHVIPGAHHNNMFQQRETIERINEFIKN
jgi:uncharacterized protein